MYLKAYKISLLHYLLNKYLINEWVLLESSEILTSPFSITSPYGSFLYQNPRLSCFPSVALTFSCITVCGNTEMKFKILTLP